MLLPFHLDRFVPIARGVVQAVAAHTGIPVIIVAGGVLVFSYRLFRRSVKFAVELAFAALLLGVLAHFGWIRF